MCTENADVTIWLPRNWRCLSTDPFSKKFFSAKSDNISRDEKYAFQTPKAYCVDWIGTISTVDENACDPQMIAAKAFVPFRDGSALTVNSPFEIDGVTKIASTKRPSVGQHNDEILGVWVRRALSRPDPTKSKIMTMNRKDAAAGAFFVAVLTLGYSGFFVVNLQ